MINETTNYKIKKPTPDEYYDIALNNDNADIIDGAIKINADAIATKQAIITGSASTIASANLPVKKAVMTDSTGKITTADVTDVELGYVKGVTGGIQAQINTKSSTSVVTSHTGDSVIHVTAQDKSTWNAKTTDAVANAHIGDTVPHVTAGDKTAWNAKETTSGAQTKATTALNSAKSYVDGKVKTDVPVGALFTDTIVNISGKVDVEVGKGLSTNDYTTVEKNKLAGVDTGANNYTHPTSHPASMITESTTKRFVTDVEKSGWNAKTDDTAVNTHDSDVIKHITGAERTAWNNKVNISTGGLYKNKFVQTDADGNIKKFDVIKSADLPAHSAELLTSGTIPSARMGSDIGRSADLTTHAGLSTHITGAERTKWDTHIADSVIHVTSGDKTNWTAGYTHISDAVKHITAGERTAWNGKVDKVTGKQLSTEDYTNAEKTKLSGIATGANNYTLPAEVLKNTAQSFNTTQQNQVKTNLDILKTWVGLEANKGTDANTIYFCLE